MTDAERRYMHARDRVQRSMIDPATELLAATRELVGEARQRAEQAEAALESFRPHWAQGYTDDSMAAQAATTALSQLWELLYAKDQTQAVTNLRRLIAGDTGGIA